MAKYGVIAGVGIIAVLMVIIGNTFRFSFDTAKGLTFTGMGILLILSSVEIWRYHWSVGLVSLIASVVYLSIGIIALTYGDSFITN